MDDFMMTVQADELAIMKNLDDYFEVMAEAMASENEN